MTIVSVVGDRCTTTAIGLVSALTDPATLVEFDPSGGSAAAWLGLPRQPSLADVVATGDPGRWDAFEQRCQTAACGVRALIAPVRQVEAAAAVGAATPMLPMLAASQHLFVVDVGRLTTGQLTTGQSTAANQAGAVVVSHRQHPGSAPAAALGVERLAEQVSTLSMRSLPVIVALHGEWPYNADEIRRFLDQPAVVAVADDPWAASVIAGRPGSERRLRRSRWWAAMVTLADRVTSVVAQSNQIMAPHEWVDGGVGHGR